MRQGYTPPNSKNLEKEALLTTSERLGCYQYTTFFPESTFTWGGVLVHLRHPSVFYVVYVFYGFDWG